MGFALTSMLEVRTSGYAEPGFEGAAGAVEPGLPPVGCACCPFAVSAGAVREASDLKDVLKFAARCLFDVSVERIHLCLDKM